MDIKASEIVKPVAQDMYGAKPRAAHIFLF